MKRYDLVKNKNCYRFDESVIQLVKSSKVKYDSDNDWYLLTYDEWGNKEFIVEILESDLQLEQIADQYYSDGKNGGVSVYYCKQKDKYIVEHVSYSQGIYSESKWFEQVKNERDKEIAYEVIKEHTKNNKIKMFREIIMESCKNYNNVNWYGIAILMNNVTGNISYVQIAGDNEITSGEHNGTQVRIYNYITRIRLII